MLEEALTDLEALLSQERDAIVALEGARVLELAGRKQELVGFLASQRSAFTPRTRARFQALAPAMRHNGILLAHARDVLRDAVAAARAGGASLIPVSSAPMKVERRSLSVQG